MREVKGNPAEALALTPQSAEALVEALFAAVNEGDLARLGALAAPNCTSRGLPFIGPMALIAPYAELRAALPELRFTVDQVFAGGDQVAVRYSGRGAQRGPYHGLAPRGNPVTVHALDVFWFDGSRIRARWSYTDHLALLQQMSDVQVGDIPVVAAEARVVSRFEPPAFLEGVLVGADGDVYVTKLHEGTVYRIRPDGTRRPFFHLDAGNGPWDGVWCMVAPADGVGFYLNVNSSDAAKHGVWYVAPDGTGRLFASLPLDTIPNGIARTPAGDLLVADSLGRVWRVNNAGDATVWLQHEWLAGRSFIGRFPGANGIQVWNGAAYVTNSDLGLVVRIPIASNGSAGVPHVAFSDIGGDDFAIDADGTLYVTTHPFNTVVRLAPDGSRAVIGTAAQGVVGPTAAALGIDGDGNRVLYVVTDGGFFTLPEDPPVPPLAQTPALLALKLD